MVKLVDFTAFLKQSQEHLRVSDLGGFVHRVIGSPVFSVDQTWISVEHITNIEKIISFYSLDKVFLQLGLVVLSSQEFTDF